jgi:hypothetical protein
MRQFEKTVKRQTDLKYNYVYCVKILSELNDKWVYVWNNKLQERILILSSCADAALAKFRQNRVIFGGWMLCHQRTRMLAGCQAWMWLVGPCTDKQVMYHIFRHNQKWSELHEIFSVGSLLLEEHILYLEVSLNLTCWCLHW